MTRDIETIINCLKSTVRYRDEKNPNFAPLPTSLTQPITNRLIYHPLLTEDNLRAIAPDFSQFIYPTYVSTTTFSKGDRVAFNNNNFESLINNNLDNQPASSPNDWEQVDLFADWLDQNREDAAQLFISSVFNAKKTERQTKILLDSLALYDRPGRINDTIINKGRLVGLEIELINHNNINVVLEKLRTQFTDLQTPITFRLFQTSQNDPVAIFDITTTLQRSAEWHDLDSPDNLLQYRDFDKNIVGGFYYLTYREDELVGQAINTRFTFDRQPCRGCSSFNFNAFQNWSQFVRIRTFEVASGEFPTNNTLWDVQENTYSQNTTFGINLTISAYCELKEFVCAQDILFGEGVAQQAVVNLLREISDNTRSNVISEKTREMARIALAAEDLGKENALEKLNTVIDTANFEISDIQKSVCLPCLPTKGMEMKSVNAGRRPLQIIHGPDNRIF